MVDSFYVCFFKDKSGERLGHAVSVNNDFPDKVSSLIEIGDYKNKGSKLPDIFKSFCDSMSGYMDMLPLVAGLGAAITSQIRSGELNQFCHEHKISHTQEETREIFEIPFGRIGDFQSIDRRARSGELVSKQIPKMLLMGIVSSLDHHLAQLMREIVRSNPKIISSSERNVSVQDVFLADSIDDFKEILIEREIDTATRDSFEEQIGWFEKRLNIREPIKNDYELWDELVEVIERRNLFAHADGIVNSRYIKKVVKSDRLKSISVGEELYASRKYFAAALDNICVFGAMIAQVVWRRIDPESAYDADAALGTFGYKLIERGEYKLAIRILEFSRSLRGKKDEKIRRMDVVNLANAYKLSGDDVKAREVLDAEDWGIVSDEFAISVNAVRGDVDLVIRYMRRMAQAADWTGEELEQWPVFFHVRDDERFLRAYETAFGRKFNGAPKSRNRILENLVKEDSRTGNREKYKSSKKKREVSDLRGIRGDLHDKSN